MTALPIIDARTSRMALEALLMPVEETRDAARTLGQLWAVISLRAVAPFLESSVECVTFLILHSTDDAKVAEFFDLAKVQAMSKEAHLFEMIGEKHEVAKHAFAVASRMSPKVGEITIRLVDDFVV